MPKKKHPHVDGGLVPPADQLFDINKKIAKEGITMNRFEGKQYDSDDENFDNMSGAATSENLCHAEAAAAPDMGSAETTTSGALDVKMEEQTISIRADSDLEFPNR